MNADWEAHLRISLSDESYGQPTRQDLQACLAEIDQLRERLGLTMEALDKVVDFGNRAHAEGTSSSHSFYFGVSIGSAVATLSKVRGENAYAELLTLVGSSRNLVGIKCDPSAPKTNL